MNADDAPIDPEPLPVEADFLDPRSRDLDERHAVSMFLGKTLAEAEAMFSEHFSFYQEDLTYMRGPAFRYYVRAAMRHLLSDQADGDADAANTFCGVLELRLRFEPEALTPIAPLVSETIAAMLARFDRYGCSPDIYGDVADRYRAIAGRLAV